MIDGKIWGDTVTDFPTFDGFADCYNLASTVGAGDNILFLSVDQWRRDEWTDPGYLPLETVRSRY